MTVFNETRHTTLSKNAFKAISLKDKTLGLLDTSKPRTIILSTRFGIHTFGIKESIDVLIVDKKNTVVSLKKNLKPNTVYLWNPKYSTVIELPSGSIQKSATQIGDKLAFST